MVTDPLPANIPGGQHPTAGNIALKADSFEFSLVITQKVSQFLRILPDFHSTSPVNPGHPARYPGFAAIRVKDESNRKRSGNNSNFGISP